MDYELAKKLKDAGFPQSSDQNAPYLSEDRITNRRLISDHELVEHAAYVPYLEELIEACGNEFQTLSRDISTDDVLWLVNNYSDPEAFADGKLSGWYEGSTPTEAVAKLYLALNKK